MNNILRNFSSVLLKNKSCYSTEVYKSTISTQNLYPGSNPKITTPKPPQNDGKFTGFIPLDELSITYSRSSGPGGQNVNMVNSKVDLRFHVEKATWIPPELKNKLVEKYKNRISKEGYMVFRSELTRSQQLNLADCLQKVRTTIYSLMTTEPVVQPETEEKIRRRKEKACRERLMIKRQRSQIKNDRQEPTLNL